MNEKQRVFVTGGAGFIGSNLVARLLDRGCEVTVLDNLSRFGTPSNLEWLRDRAGHGRFHFVQGDVTDEKSLLPLVQKADAVFHLAAQVAVTSSVQNPRRDFLDNAYGTFNLLEAVRQSRHQPILIYASTNKVYGGMQGVRVLEEEKRYCLPDFPFGIPETFPLDFHSPYGCSKGAADQYVHDYSRIYGLRTVVLRQSCIYGYRQFGLEDQGWLAWFIIACLKRRPITIYGDGKQARDVLFIEDLLEAYEGVVDGIERTSGKIYNIGGGPLNILSVWCEFGEMLAALLGRRVQVTYADWRPGDQEVFVSDIRKAEAEFGWRPQCGVSTGVGQLFSWIQNNLHLFSKMK